MQTSGETGERGREPGNHSPLVDRPPGRLRALISEALRATKYRRCKRCGRNTEHGDGQGQEVKRQGVPVVALSVKGR